jgi:ribosomal protein S6--L-glutamate ligase
MMDIALRCGATFGLDIYGVDTVETAQGPAVIEVNEFPNFTGVPDAAAHIADYILAQVGRRSGLGSTTRAYRVPYPPVGS